MIDEVDRGGGTSAACKRGDHFPMSVRSDANGSAVVRAYHAAMNEVDAASPATVRTPVAESASSPIFSLIASLAEAVNAYETGLAHPIEDGRAVAAARTADGGSGTAHHRTSPVMEIAAALEGAVHHVRVSLAVLVACGMGLAVLAGAAAARAALGAPGGSHVREPVNFFWVLATLLGIQTLALVIWALMVLLGRRFVARRVAASSVAFDANAGSSATPLWVASLGGVLVRAAQRLVGWIHSGPLHAAAALAVTRVNFGGRLGVWTLSAITNGLWLSFNLGCLAMIMLLLSTRQYTFAWETTILSERAYTPLTKAIAALPRTVGFPVPDDDQIRASQWRGSADDFSGTSASHAWAGLLAGALVLYGLSPRAVIVALCLGQRRRIESDIA